VICVDASVAIKWLFSTEQHSAQARALLVASFRDREPLVAPPLLLSEVTNALRQRIRRGLLELSEARSLLTGFQELHVRIRLLAPDVLYDRALVLASERGLSATYDAQYVALAQLLGTPLWTADERLVAAVHSVDLIRLIADYV
jgi:predicted nucleic acid-binding protein